MDTFFKTIDTEVKAYFLGLIASNGSILKEKDIVSVPDKEKRNPGTETPYDQNKCSSYKKDLKKKEQKTLRREEKYREIRDNGDGYRIAFEHPNLVQPNTLYLRLPKREKDFLSYLKDLVGTSRPLHKNATSFILEMDSKSLLEDVCMHFRVEKFERRDLGFPVFANDILKWVFVRGLYDGESNVFLKEGKNEYDNSTKFIAVHMVCRSEKMRTDVKKFTQFPFETTDSQLQIYGFSALDFLDRMYAYGDMPKLFSMFAYRKFVEILNMPLTNTPIFHIELKDKDAVYPMKFRLSDAGMDLTVIKVLKTVGRTVFFDTGISVYPQYGFYCKIYPRSSISKLGYIMANSTGIIDSTYTGTIIIALIKVDESMPDIELPCRVAQLVPERSLFPRINLVSNRKEESERGNGGFGSTNKQKDE